MHEIDPHALAQAAGAAWMILVGLLAVTLGVLSLLIPLFIWRIWHWTRATCKETERLNTRLDQLLVLLTPRAGTRGPEGEFLFGSPPDPSDVVPAAGSPEAQEPSHPEPVPPAPAEAVPLSPDPRRPDARLARCGGCGHKIAYPESLAGRKARCPSCKAPLSLP